MRFRRAAPARGKRWLPPPEALDHQPVGIDVVDALRRAEIDDGAAATVREVVAVDDERHALPGHRIRGTLAPVHDFVCAAPSELHRLRRQYDMGALQTPQILPDRRSGGSWAATDVDPNDVVLVAKDDSLAASVLRPALWVLHRVAGAGIVEDEE